MRWMEVTLVLGPTRAENAGITLLPIPIPSKFWKALDADRTKENLPMPGLELAMEFIRPFQSPSCVGLPSRIQGYLTIGYY
jgi:hypothetical protein